MVIFLLDLVGVSFAQVSLKSPREECLVFRGSNKENIVLDLHPIVNNQTQNNAVRLLSTRVTDLFQEPIFVPDPVISLAVEARNKVCLAHIMNFVINTVQCSKFCTQECRTMPKLGDEKCRIIRLIVSECFCKLRREKRKRWCLKSGI